MTSHRFFVRRHQIDFPWVHLDGEEHHHLSKVIRIREGEEVILFDEQGLGYRARVVKQEPERSSLQILESLPPEAQAVRVVLAMALIKPRGLQWILQKGTEMGMSAFVPVIAARTVVRIPRESEGKKLARWIRITREAAKQCGRVQLPTVSRPMPLEEFLQGNRSALAFFLYEGARGMLRDILLDRRDRLRDAEPELHETPEITVLIGPEGGWTKQEADDIVEHGFVPVSLGDHILRAETAALCSLALLTQFWV